MAALHLIFKCADSCGNLLLAAVTYYFEVLLLTYMSTRAVVLSGRRYIWSVLKVTLEQIYIIGYEALTLITLLGLALGGMIMLNLTALSFLGSVEAIARISVIAIIRELGPLIVALILIARSGSAMSTEIADMKVNRELDALNVMAINPLSYIVFPRILAGILTTLSLAFLFCCIALVGGFWVTRIFHELPFFHYFQVLFETLSVEDVFLFLIKNSVNGLIIFSICCFQGLEVKNSPHEVPLATTKAVLKSISSVAFCSLLSTIIFYYKQIMEAVGS